MSMTSPAGSPLPPPPSGGAVSHRLGDRERPWWNEIDVLLAVVWFVVAMILASIISVIASVVGGDDIATEPVYAVFFGTLAFQIGQAFYPWFVSRRKGLGLTADWRFTASLPTDIGFGVLLAVGCFLGSGIATAGAAALVGLEDSNDASNTGILTDNRGSLWIYGIIFLVCVGAPLVEELLFRGLILRALEKSFGAIAAIIMSSLLFALPHWQPNATWQETVVLLSALATVGLVLAIGAIRTNRLGACIIAHFLFNATGTALALG